MGKKRRTAKVRLVGHRPRSGWSPIKSLYLKENKGELMPYLAYLIHDV
jgi:hypothetical protein